MTREYPVALTYEEINAVQGALKNLDAEYGLGSSFYASRPLSNDAPVAALRAEARRATDEANEKAAALLAKISKLAEDAAELEPTT